MPRSDYPEAAPVLESDRLRLRRPQASDLDAYTRYCSGDRTVFVGGPFPAEKAFEKLAAMIGHWDLRGFGRLVLTDQDTGRALGHVGAMQLSTAEPPEFTWTLWDGTDEGKGYAFEACECYRDFAITELGFSKMIARVVSENTRSRQLAEKLGGVLNEDAPAPDWLEGCVTYDFDFANDMAVR